MENDGHFKKVIRPVATWRPLGLMAASEIQKSQAQSFFLTYPLMFLAKFLEGVLTHHLVMSNQVKCQLR